MYKLYLLYLICCLVTFGSARADTPRYCVTKITDGSQERTETYALNNHGDVVGRMGDRAFLWRQGKLTFLEKLKGSHGNTANDINDSGQIVGTASFGNWKRKYFFWQKGKTQDLGEAAALFGQARINNKGEALLRVDGDQTMRAALWQNGKRKDLGAWWPWGINDHTQIVGSESFQYKRHHVIWAVTWEKGVTIEARGRDSVGTLINNKRSLVIVEWSLHTKGKQAVFLVENGQRTAIIAPDDQRVAAAAINDKSQIVGWVNSANDKSRAFLWQSKQFLDLNECIPADSGWMLTQALDINEKGQIVGSGTHNGVICAFLLTPLSQN